MDGQTGLLLVSASETNANMFYATRFGTSSTFIYLETAEERLIVIGNLEIERAREAANVDRVLPLVQYWKMAQEKHQKPPGTEEVVDVLMRDLGLNRVIVPPDFSIKFADGIRNHGHTVEVKLEPFFERRLAKDEREIGSVRETVLHTETAIAQAIDTIRSARISATGILELGGEPLTSERVRRSIHQYLIEHDCVASHSVVSCGPQTASLTTRDTAPCTRTSRSSLTATHVARRTGTTRISRALSFVARLRRRSSGSMRRFWTHRCSPTRC